MSDMVVPPRGGEFHPFPFRFAKVIAPKTGLGRERPNDDKVEAHRNGDNLFILVADGATGVGDGWKASSMLAEVFMNDALLSGDERTSSRVMRNVVELVDRRLAKHFHGEVDTTGIALVCNGDRVRGASAGDSEAWLFGKTQLEITCQQVRKPRIGSGAKVTTFDVPFDEGSTLVVASDGLWGHVRMDDVEREVASVRDVERLAQALLALVETNNDGTFPDDVAIAVVRR